MLPSSDRLRRAATGVVAAHLGWEIATLARARRTAVTALASPSGPLPAEAADDGPELHLLVPGLREQSYVARTVQSFAALRSTHARARIWFVTTARERPYGEDDVTTRDLLERTLGGMDSERMTVLHDPRVTGNKASQLNWAVQQIDQRARSSPDRTWIGVFDFDSQADPTTAARVAARARDHGEEVIQVVPIGTTALGGAPTAALSRGVILVEALHQAVRSLGVERWKLDRATAGRRMPQYVMGAGLFVRRDALCAAGGFPFVDDVPLGYRLFLNGARFATVPVLNRVDLPDSIAAHLASLKFVARGVVSWPSVLAVTQANPSVSQRDRIRLAALGLADTAEITVYPWLAAAVTPALLRRSWQGRFLAALWWAFPVAQTAVMRHVLANELDLDAWRAPAPILVAASVGRRFWRTFGAWWLAADLARAQLQGGTVTFNKADRSAALASDPAGGAQ